MYEHRDSGFPITILKSIKTFKLISFVFPSYDLEEEINSLKENNILHYHWYNI